MTEGQPICVSHEGPVARIRLSRPDKLNPLDWSTVKALKGAVADLQANGDIRFVVITGDGRSFSAGGDLDGYLKLYREPDEFRAFLEDFYALLTGIEQARAIYIAAVNGVCVAGGIELLLACDLAIAAAAAKIGDGHLNFGQLPGAGGSQRLPRAVGLTRAKQLMLSGELLDAQTALHWGLVGRVAPDEDLAAVVDETLGQLRAKSPAGLMGAKRLANLTLQMDYDQGLRAEMDYVHRYATTEPDATEGLLAFKEKRPPRFGASPPVADED